jgi:hypothetical protein
MRGEQKHFTPEPVITSVPANYKDYNVFALYLLAYSNRIMFKTCTKLKAEMQLPFGINTLHIRYLLLIHFISCTKDDKCVRLRDIEIGDYPIRSKKRATIGTDLVKCKLATVKQLKTRGRTTEYYSVTDAGYIAINSLLEYLHEVYHTHPTTNKTGIRPNVDATMLQS